MPEIILRTNAPGIAAEVLAEALAIEAQRLKYSKALAKKRLRRFEKKYHVTSDDFINNMTAEDLNGSDVEYVEWAGEYKLLKRLNERMSALKSIKHVTA